MRLLASASRITRTTYRFRFGPYMMVSDAMHFNIRNEAMADDEQMKSADSSPRVLAPAARRALAEAELRRETRQSDRNSPKEIGGRGGQEPVRYGDWEVKGLATDF